MLSLKQLLHLALSVSVYNVSWVKMTNVNQLKVIKIKEMIYYFIIFQEVDEVQKTTALDIEGPRPRLQVLLCKSSIVCDLELNKYNNVLN